MKKLAKIGIFTNLAKDIKAKAAKSLILDLKDKAEFFIGDNAKEEFEGYKLIDPKMLSLYCDFIVAFGGDGTILKIVSIQENRSVPILGIDLGTVGFLSEVKINEATKAVLNVLNGNYSIIERSLISVEYNNKTALALNEIALAGPRTSCLATFDISINNEKCISTKGDGVMVVTPTGSTAYSLSCSGPIIAPNVNAFIVNSICAYPIRTVPLIVNDNSVIKVYSEHENLKLIVDGREMLDFDNSNAKIIVKKAKEPIKFIQFKEEHTNFYQKIVKKLKIWRTSYES